MCKVVSTYTGQPVTTYNLRLLCEEGETHREEKTERRRTEGNAKPPLAAFAPQVERKESSSSRGCPMAFTA